MKSRRKSRRIGSYRYRVEIWLSREWSWRLVSQRNGKIVADSAETYKKYGSCENEAKLVFSEQWPMVRYGRKDDVELGTLVLLPI